MARGQDIRIPQHYDPQTNPRSPSYDPAWNTFTVTGHRPHQPPQEQTP